MSKIIRTLSLEGYLKRKANDGYAVAICSVDHKQDPCEIVVQAFSESEYYPLNSRVNVATGEFTAPVSMLGLYTVIHSGQLAENQQGYRLLNIPEFNTFIKLLNPNP